MWPTRSQARRERWRAEAERRVAALGGRVLSRSSIEEEGFIYETLLVALSASSVRELIAHPGSVEGLATLNGLQFVLPQVIAQSLPNQSEPLDAPGVDGTGQRHSIWRPRFGRCSWTERPWRGMGASTVGWSSRTFMISWIVRWSHTGATQPRWRHSS